ncbi:M48 family metalloprotease [Candidatus Saccharibacteria bacterium]|nr:M48 family metalloprotease [Candidatus Saccharibacteria bacterium]MBR3377860.1 M48 family metalloprotease [Candidatus Saccharibacteria bacterium]
MAVSVHKQIAQNKRNTVFIAIVFVAFIALIGGIFAWLYNSPAVLITVAVMAIAYALVQYFLADKLAILGTGARQIEKSENPRFYKIVEKLAEDTKLPMPKVYVIEDPAPNAFATGRDPQHACVAATTGLLEIMDDKELRAVMGHEMSHVKNYDIRVSMIAFGLTAIVGLISDIGLRMLFWSDRDEENNSPVGVVFALFTIILAPFVATLIKLAISRQREYLADASSASITDPNDMISALRKLDTHVRPMRQQNVAAEALFIAGPLKKSFISRLFSTHPPMEARIERLENAKK